MKIAYFCESLPPNTDGVAHVYKNLGHYLEKREDVKFRFFSPFKPGPEISWHDSVEKLFSVPYPAYPSYRITLPYFQKLNQKLDRFDPDLIHVSSPTATGWKGLRYARKNDLPAVAAYHTHFAPYFDNYGLRSVKKLAWSYIRSFYNRFDRVYAPCNTTKEMLEKKGFKRVRLWQRGVDLTKFSPEFRSKTLRARLRTQHEPVLFYAGRLAREKNLEQLIEMNNILKDQDISFQLVLAGDGPLREKLEKELPDAVFAGFLHGEELSTWYASSDLFVLPSTSETFGNVVLEAAASGLPSVVTDEGGVVDLVRNGKTGFITRANDAKHFSKHIKILIEKPSLRNRMGARANRFARQFNWNHVHRRLIADCRSLANIDVRKKSGHTPRELRNSMPSKPCWTRSGTPRLRYIKEREQEHSSPLFLNP